jgi:hypothetical protein
LNQKGQQELAATTRKVEGRDKNIKTTLQQEVSITLHDVVYQIPTFTFLFNVKLIIDFPPNWA